MLNRIVLASIALAFTTLAIIPDNAEAGWRRAARRGYGYGGACCGASYGYGGYGGYGGGYGGACGGGACGIQAAPMQTGGCCTSQMAAPIQATGCCGVAQTVNYGGWSANACSVQPAGYQSYDHTTGYAPQGQIQGTYGGSTQVNGTQPPPPPPAHDGDQPQTFREDSNDNNR